MGARRTAWHFFFSILLRERGPSWIEVRPEVPLGSEPPRLDYLLLRRADKPMGDSGRTLRGLWPRLPLFSIVELKTIGRPYRKGALDRLWSYVHAFFADTGDEDEAEERPPTRNDLAAVLIVPSRTPSLETDLDAMGISLRDLGGGYAESDDGLFRLLIVEIDPVAEGEDDDLLRLFGHAPEQTLEARRFWARFVGSKEAGMSVQEMEGYDEVMQKLLDMLTPEQRIAGLAPEQVLASFSPDQILLALPDSVLRLLPDDYIATLPEPARKAIRKRIGR